MLEKSNRITVTRYCPSLVCCSFLCEIKTEAFVVSGQSEVIGPNQPVAATVGDDIILPCYLYPTMDASDMTMEWSRPDLDLRLVHVWPERPELQNPSYKGRTSLFINEMKNGEISLKISRVKPSDEGKYRCFVPDLRKDSNVQLVVSAISSPVISFARLNKSISGVVLQCESAGWYPEPELLWLDGEGNLLSAGPTETLRGPDDLYTVSSRVTVCCSFLCEIKTEAFVVLGQSEVIGPNQPVAAIVGDDIILPCYLYPTMDASDMTVEWSRPDLDLRLVHVWPERPELQNPSYKGRTSLFINEMKHGEISLKISRVKASDEGKYRCFFPDLRKDSNVQLVVSAVSSPVISFAGLDKSISGVVLQCESAGWYPEPELLWLDGEGNLLSAGPTETLRGPDDLYTVSSRVTVEKRHSNNITCRVQQRNTNQSRETHIHVPGKSNVLFNGLNFISVKGGAHNSKTEDPRSTHTKSR
uniref:Ig-like domain-containing protein n=1 Tax=Neolamprologus brichardi TaxID=32507 RepID=A0A3Q4G3X4_NEOBR